MKWTSKHHPCTECGSPEFRITEFDSDDSHLDLTQMKFRAPGQKIKATNFDGNHHINSITLTCEGCSTERMLTK